MGSVVAGIGLKTPHTEPLPSEALIFLVGKHCEVEAENFLKGLEGKGFSTSFQKINYDNGEFSQVSYVASVSHKKFGASDLERYANGAMSKCWTSSFSNYDLADREDLSRAVNYIAILNRYGDAPILVSVSSGTMIIRAKKKDQ